MTQEKLKAFRLGSINAQLSKAAPFIKKKELREERKRVRFLKITCMLKLKPKQYSDLGCDDNLHATAVETQVCIY